jgi:hypothetical protein
LDSECEHTEGGINKIHVDWGVINDDSTGDSPFFAVLQIVFSVCEGILYSEAFSQKKCK